MRTLVLCCVVLLSVLSAFLRAEDKPKANLEIVKAVYGDIGGPAKNQADVTAKVKAMVRPNEDLSVEATNNNFGDPCDGIVKRLKVEYILDGAKGEQTVNENQTLIINAKRGKLFIEKAWFGDPNDEKKRADVTAIARSMVFSDALALDASVENFGDPAKGAAKVLSVEYTFEGGAKKTKQAKDGETLKIDNGQ
ncbi:MAG TPA: DUF3395 domain-containing protein [Planctomycetota bacterium]|jgi:hypothetical protein